MNIYPHATRFSQVVKSIASAGVYTQDLGGFQIGMYDANDKTRKSITNAAAAKTAYVVVGSPNQGVNQQSIRGFQDPMNTKESFKSREFGRVLNFYTMGPQYGKPFVGYLGYNGLNSTESLAFKCGTSYEFEVRVQGKVVENVYGQNEIFERFTIDTACCADDCTDDGCNDAVDCKANTDKVVALMNDPRNKVSRFGTFRTVRSCTTDPSITTYTASKWTLDVQDMGNVEALAKVKSQYPLYTVTRTARTGEVSTYTVCVDGSSSPTAFTTTGVTTMANCNVCPTGYTTNYGYDTYQVVAGSAVYANAAAVNTAYSAATGVVKTFTNNNTFTNITNDTITIASHGFVTGTKVTLTGTTAGGLTTGTSYYVVKVDANTIKLADTLAHAFTATSVATGWIDLTAYAANVQTLTPSIVTTATFPQFAATLGTTTNPTVAVYTIKVPVGMVPVIPAASTDILTYLSSTGTTCVVTTATTIAWVASNAVYKVARTLTMSVKNDDCDSTNVGLIANLTTWLALVPSYVASSLVVTTSTTSTPGATGSCLTKFTITQKSDTCMQDDCDSVDGSAFVDMPAYNGTAWTPVVVTDAATGCSCGIKVMGKTFLDIAQSCGYDPTEYKEYEQPTFEIYPVTEPAGCDTATPLWFVAQMPTFDTLDGHRVIQEILLYRQYRQENYFSPSMELGNKFSEAEGLVYGVSPSKRYFVVHALVQYNGNSNLTSSYGDNCEDIQLFFEDITLRDQWIAIFATMAGNAANAVTLETRVV